MRKTQKSKIFVSEHDKNQHIIVRIIKNKDKI